MPLGTIIGVVVALAMSLVAILVVVFIVLPEARRRRSKGDDRDAT